MKSQQSTNTFVKETFMDLKTQLKTVAKNHQASIQNLETKFNRLADKKFGRPSGSLPSNNQPNLQGSNSKAYQPSQAHNEHANAIFTRSGKSYNPPDNLDDQQNNSENPINFDTNDEDTADEVTTISTKLLLLEEVTTASGNDMDQDSAYMVATSKVHMLKPGEFELWRMRIEQYIHMIDYALWEVTENDYALWEVTENGLTLPKTQVVEGVITLLAITSVEDKAQRRLEVKARSTLMMGIPNEHQLKFNSIKDAKLLLEAVEKRFGGNAATKKTQRNLLKQQYKNFTAPSSEMLDQTFDRLQKFNTNTVVWRNKAELETMSIDDLYNNLKVYEPEVKGMSSLSSSIQNMAFVSSLNNNTSSSNEAVNAAHGVTTASTQVNTAYFTNIDNLSNAVICSFFASQPNSPQLAHKDLQHIHTDDIEETDLR
ncbi:hypothetical protein Tco_0134957 [Tanacetum coccineum]